MIKFSIHSVVTLQFFFLAHPVIQPINILQNTQKQSNHISCEFLPPTQKLLDSAIHHLYDLPLSIRAATNFIFSVLRLCWQSLNTVYRAVFSRCTGVTVWTIGTEFGICCVLLSLNMYHRIPLWAMSSCPWKTVSFLHGQLMCEQSTSLINDQSSKLSRSIFLYKQ